ncbi:hypothetical protein ACFWNK_07865 [Streptomyces sp. NPDC058417]|uniref:hypothetical protein n=1 Tax=unclassified Streptomyces TaxID=2593676 RepID=UPI003669FEE6
MAEPITGWIWDRHLRVFLELLSRYSGYAFGDLDWETVAAAVQDTDDETSGRWYTYPLAGADATVDVALARAVGGAEVSVRVTGADTAELRLRTDTLLTAFAAAP